MFFDAFWKSANLIKKMKRNHANVANGILYNSSIENDWKTKGTENQKQTNSEKFIQKSYFIIYGIGSMQRETNYRETTIEFKYRIAKETYIENIYLFRTQGWGYLV